MTNKRIARMPLNDDTRHFLKQNKMLYVRKKKTLVSLFVLDGCFVPLTQPGVALDAAVETLVAAFAAFYCNARSLTPAL